MVPASLKRSASVPKRPGGDLDLGGYRRQPDNVPLAVRAQIRTLVVSGAILWALGIGLLLGYVWVRLKVVEAGYRLSATRQLVERLQQEGRELAVRAAAADASDRLRLLARERLGMRPPKPGEEGVPR
jgi:cell division protein FtsL